MDDTDLEERIAQVRQVQRFGEEELGLEFWELFSEVDPEAECGSYSLYASRSDRFEAVMPYYLTRKLFFWWAKPMCRVPLVNRIAPCLSSFFRSHGTPLVTRKLNPFSASFSDEKDAEEEAEELREQGHDVWLYRPMASADNAKLTGALLRQSPAGRIYTVLHEGTHTTLARRWWEGSTGIPREVEEAICHHIGQQAGLEYAATHDPDSVPALEQWAERWERIVAFSNGYYERLSRCYAEGGDRRPILAEADEEAGGLGIDDEINNAYLVHLRQYTEHSHLVKGAFEGVDLKSYLAAPDEMNTAILERIARAAGGA